MFASIKDSKVCYVFFLLLCLLFSCSKDSSQSDLSTNALIDEFISSSNSYGEDVQSIWQELKLNQQVIKKGSDKDLRPPFVTIQFIFESVIANMLEQHQIRKTVAVIYTSQPPTPLRTKGTHVEELADQKAKSDKDRINTVLIRHKSIHNYLSNGGLLYAIYENPKEEDKISGFDIYKENLAKYTNVLFDTPVDKINTEYIGASYLIEYDNGEQILFAIRGKQINDATDGSWSLYYGNIKSGTTTKKYYKAISRIYDKHAVPFDLNEEEKEYEHTKKDEEEEQTP